MKNKIYTENRVFVLGYIPDYEPEYYLDEDTVAHIQCDGARFHVLSWYINSSGHAGTRCSCHNCIVNKIDDERKKSHMEKE